MTGYKHILLAVDLTDESRELADKARQFKESFGARISIIHVIEPLSFAYGSDVPMDLHSIQGQIQSSAETHLADFAKSLDIAAADRHIIFGRPEAEIRNLAKDAEVDLIVVGSHGRHGLALLLGSTANGVLHGAQCDVLAIRVGR